MINRDRMFDERYVNVDWDEVKANLDAVFAMDYQGDPAILYKYFKAGDIDEKTVLHIIAVDDRFGKSGVNSVEDLKNLAAEKNW
jgi:hypothetical protein